MLCYHDNMQGIIIPKTFTRQDDLVVIPRKEYEELLSQQNSVQGPPRKFKTFAPTVVQLRDLKKARKEFKQGKFMSFDELKRKLAIKD